jgi:hypothetical protein
VIDGGDYGIIDNNIQAQGAPFPVSGIAGGSDLSAVMAVPEPGSLSIVGLAAASLVVGLSPSSSISRIGRRPTSHARGSTHHVPLRTFP